MSQSNPVALCPDDQSEVPQIVLVEPSEQEEFKASTTSSQEISKDSDNVCANRSVRIDSLGVAMLDRFSLVRIFRDQWYSRIAYYRSESGGGLSLEQALEAATHKIDEQQAAEIYESLLTRSVDTINFSDLFKLWEHSPEKAELIWRQMKEEAKLEFMTGHLAAMVFQPAGWMREAFERAKFLAVRDSFFAEYEPDGGIEIALVDAMAQAHFLSIHWTKVAALRTKSDPRRHNDEYRVWEAFKRETCRKEMWYPGKWELPYATEVECQEQAVRMADHFSRLFQRTVKSLDNHRLAKAKLKRLSA